VKVKTLCKGCGQLFERFSNETKIYCSKKCFIQYVKGKTYDERYGRERSLKIRMQISEKGKINNQKRPKNKKLSKECPVCKKIFEYYSYPSKPERFFCSNKCKFEYCRSKTFEEFHGIEKAKQIRKNMRLAKQRNGPKKYITTDKVTENLHGYGKFGRRPDLNNQFFRSTWEANFARICNYYGTEWEYEPEKFWLPDIKVHYFPDFYLPEVNCYVELSGISSPFKLSKIKNFSKNFPETPIIHITLEEWKGLSCHSVLINNWETTKHG
jgi:hypothetical protein